MRDVTPLKKNRRISRNTQHRPVRIHKTPCENTPAERFSGSPAYGDTPTIIDFARSGVQPNTLKKLRQGKLPLESELDLHGMTVEQARAALDRFLLECLEFGYRCICIVHGKGYSSPGNRAVIKPMLNRWLREAGEVLAFHSALPKHGGSGAVYVLLKRLRE